MRLLITFFLLGFTQLFINIAHASPRVGIDVVHHKFEKNPSREEERRKRRTTKIHSTKKVKENSEKTSRLSVIRNIRVKRRVSNPIHETDSFFHTKFSTKIRPYAKHTLYRNVHSHVSEKEGVKRVKKPLSEFRLRNEHLGVINARSRYEQRHLAEVRLREKRDQITEQRLHEERQHLAMIKRHNGRLLSYRETNYHAHGHRQRSHLIAARGNNPIHLSRKQLAEFLKVRAAAIAKLMRQMGKPYLWGGTSPKTGFDCSGLVWYAYKDLLKFKLPRTANEMFHFRDAKPVSRDRLQKGDLVFFHIRGHLGADHVGVYLGHGKFIQAPRTGEEIHISKLADSYWQRHYIGARRMITPSTVR